MDPKGFTEPRLRAHALDVGVNTTYVSLLNMFEQHLFKWEKPNDQQLLTQCQSSNPRR